MKLIGAAALILATLLWAAPAHAQTDTTYRWGAYNQTSHEVDSPTAFAGLGDIVQIAAGNASDVALDSSGNVWVVGLGLDGDLGQGNVGNDFTPEEVPGLPDIAGIAEFQNTDVAWTSSGVAYGWGFNRNGGLCTGNTTEYKSPVLLSNLSGVVSAAGGQDHMMYLLSSGALVGCGENSNGQLGDGSTANADTPQTVTFSDTSPISSISSGNLTSTAVLEDGTVWDWGSNQFGNLGDGNKTDSDVPVPVDLPAGVTASQVATGGSLVSNGQSLALTSAGVYAWGNDSNGQLGCGMKKTSVTTPILASALPSRTWTLVVSGGATSYALDASGEVYGFGLDAQGEVGDGGSSGSVLTPTLVLTGANLLSSTADDALAHTG